MATRVSNEQLEELLEFLSENPGLARGVGYGIRSKETIERLWNDLAIRLNSHGSGSTKSGERWKKYWADLKHKSKSRLVKRKNEHLGTGGGPSSHGDISELDDKILSIIGEQAVYGDTQHKIPFFNTNQTIVDDDKDNNEELPDVFFDGNKECVSNAETSNLQYESSSQYIDSETHITGMSPLPCLEIELPPNPLLPDCESQTRVPIQDNSPLYNTSRKRPHCAVTKQRSVRPNPPKRTVTSQSNNQNSQPKTKPSPAWVVELERKRIDAEQKMADAAMIIAEAARQQAETALTQAKTNESLVQIVRQQSNDIKCILMMLRGETINASTLPPDHNYN